MSPIPGIAATVARDTDLAAHPAVLVYHNFTSKDYIRYAFIHGGAGSPTLDDDCEIIDVPEYGVKGVRLWASYTKEGVVGNERIVSWWCTAEPKLSGAQARPWHRDYGDGYTHLFIRYLLKIGEDVLPNAGVLQSKLPGMTGTYDINGYGIQSPTPPFSAFATWEARMYQGAPVNGRFPLGVYYYGCFTPSGTPASIGKYDGTGLGAWLIPDAWLVPGQWHCVEQEVKLNTVKDATRRVPKATDLNEQLVEMFNNANADGEMRVWLDGVKVYETTKIGYRGLDCVRIQSIPFIDIYQGGHGTYPKGPEHYDLAAVVAATKYIGPPKGMSEPGPATVDTLGALAASMNAGTWAELLAQDIDGVVGVGHSGDTEVAIPYANSAPWCPIRKRIVIVGMDNGDSPRHIEYDDATNRFLLIERTLGSHHYQHVAVDPYAGDVYLWLAGNLYRYTGQEWALVTLTQGLSQLASLALAWWSGPFPGAGGHGVLTVYSGNAGTISAFDPTTGAWLNHLDNMLPGQRGEYHVVSAYSARHNCLVYGGGNPVQGASPVDRQLWRLNADLSKTRMPDAPHHVGIFSGMNFVSDSASGNVIALGFGEGWELNPSGAGSWVRMTGSRAPPDGLLSPNASPNSVISCDVTSFGAVVYIDALRTRQPKCRMWVYKSAGAGVNPAGAVANYDGQWWNAPAGSEAGWGINFAHQGEVIFATWFTHDANGNAWYMSMTALQTGPATFAGTLYSTTGPPLGANPFDPNQVQRIAVGSANLTFSDGNNGTFAYTVNGISQTKPITRQVFGPLPACTWGGLANLALATNYQGLWWAVGGVESGWGINFTHQGDVIFATWFTYDFTGAALPLSGTLTKVGPGTYSGSLIKTSGPAFYAVPFDPNAVTRAEVGTATVTFSDGNAATLSYQVSLGGQTASGAKTIQRQVFRAPGTVCQ